MSNEQYKIHIVGLGVAEHVELVASAQTALRDSDVVMGSERQLKSIERLLEGYKLDARKLEGHKYISEACILPRCMLLPKLSELKGCIDQLEGKQISVLASGDPLYYGIGRWFCHQFTFDRLRFHPAVSSIQAACHKRGISLQDVEVLSLHGRPLEKIRTKLKMNTQLIILTDKYSHPVALARECAEAGFSESRLTVCENLGYESERIQSYAVDELLATGSSFSSPVLTFSALNIVIIDVIGQGKFLPVFPGIPDDHYITGAEPGKGMISKREVRLIILSFLQAGSEDVIWDVGAGCGGVAIELAYWNERATVYAMECNRERAVYLRQNSARFGVGSNLHIHEARAPACFIECPAPNKVFIGGSDGELDVLLRDVWQRLPVNGVLVVSSVVEKSKRCVQDFIKELCIQAQPYYVESTEVLVRRGKESEGTLTYREKLPVEIFKFVKST